MADKLTDRKVKALPAPEGKYRIHYDTEVAGFGVRVTKAGVRSFVLNYSASGRERRYTIGKYPAWSVAAARAEAGDLRQYIDRGGDPMAERAAGRAEPTVAVLCDEYLEYAKGHNRASTLAHYRESIDRFIRPEIGALKLSAVKHRDIEKLHRSVTDHNGPYQANRMVAVVSKMMNVAIKWGWRSDNPAKGVERNQEQKRNRYLSGPELRRLCQALADYPYREKVRLSREQALKVGHKSEWRERDKPIREREQSCNALRLMMLTGARKGEVLAARWEQFDFDGGTWTKPGATTKQKTDHRIPLSAPTLELLSKMPSESDWLFPGRDDGHQVDVKKTWASIRELAEIPDVRIHDLRHTYAAQLASAGLSLPIIGALLGHTQAATTARYAHLMDDPLREATERVGAAYSSAQTGHKADVVDIRRGGNNG